MNTSDSLMLYAKEKGAIRTLEGFPGYILQISSIYLITRLSSRANTYHNTTPPLLNLPHGIFLHLSIEILPVTQTQIRVVHKIRRQEIRHTLRRLLVRAIDHNAADTDLRGHVLEERVCFFYRLKADVESVGRAEGGVDDRSEDLPKKIILVEIDSLGEKGEAIPDLKLGSGVDAGGICLDEGELRKEG